MDRKMLPPSHAGLSRAHIESTPLPCAHGPVPGPALLRGSPAVGPRARCPALPPAPAPARVMDGRGAGCLSGLIDEVCADSRRVTLGGGRRARDGGRAQTQRRSGSAPGRQPPPLRCAPARLRGGGGGRGSASRAWRPCSSPGSSLRLPGFPFGPPTQRCPEPAPLQPSPLSLSTSRPVLRSYPGGPGLCRRARPRRQPALPQETSALPEGRGRALEAGLRRRRCQKYQRQHKLKRRMVRSTGIIPARRERRKISTPGEYSLRLSSLEFLYSDK